jgi:hypothetical protein
MAMSAPRALALALALIPAGCTLLAPLEGLTGSAPSDGWRPELPDALPLDAPWGVGQEPEGAPADVADWPDGAADSSPVASLELVQHVSLGVAIAPSNGLQFPVAVTAGDLIVAVMLTNNPGDTGAAYGISDSLGNAWKSTNYRQCPSSVVGAQIWYAESAHPGVDAVTASQSVVSSTGGQLGLGLFEYRGLAASGTLDVESSQCAATATTAMATPGITTTGPDLVVALFVDPCGTGAMMAGSGFEPEDINTYYFYLFQDRLNGGAGVPAGFVQATATDPQVSSCWLAAIAAFKVQ